LKIDCLVRACLKKASGKKTATKKKSTTKKASSKKTTAKKTDVKPKVEKKVEIIKDVSTSKPLDVIQPKVEEKAVEGVKNGHTNEAPKAEPVKPETKKPNAFVRFITFNWLFGWWS